jgi:hypothetical protein
MCVSVRACVRVCVRAGVEACLRTVRTEFVKIPCCLDELLTSKCLQTVIAINCAWRL